MSLLEGVGGGGVAVAVAFALLKIILSTPNGFSP